MKANDLFGAALESAKQSVVNAKERERVMRKQRRSIMSVLKLITPALDDRTDHVYISTWSDGTYVINVNMCRLEGFKDQRLAHALYAAMCIKDVQEKPTADYAESLTREYRYSFMGNSLNINAYVRSDSETCRKVKIGEELQIVAQYKIECD